MNDTRLIEDMCFAVDKRADDPSGGDPKIVPDDEAAAKVRAILKGAGLVTAQDIIDHGCTGLVGKGVSIEDAAFVRSRMAGAAIGLPCYVPLRLYCLVHDVIGGLQEGQAPQFATYIATVSRELTKEELKKVDFVESVRRSTTRGSLPDRIADAKGQFDKLAEAERDPAAAPKKPWEPPTVTPVGNIADLLARVPHPGNGLDAAVKLLDAVKLAQYGLCYGMPVPRLIDALKTSGQERLAMIISLAIEQDGWRCHEHDEVFWGCRFCVASLVAKGSLEPALRIFRQPLPGAPALEPDDAEIEDFEAVDLPGVLTDLFVSDVYVKAATFVPGLTREP